MDTLVARYSRPAYQQNEAFSEQEQQDLADGVPSLSLKFAMPPVAHVSCCFSITYISFD
jgi:20S proteasome subunit beta 5